MNKKIFSFVVISILALALVSTSVLAKSDNSISRDRTHVTLPKDAVEISPGVFSLGSKLYEGKIVEGYAFFSYKEDTKKSLSNNVFNSKQSAKSTFSYSTTSSCYGYLATGAKWKTIEPYYIDPTNNLGLDMSVVASNVDFDINKWEDAANGIMNDGRSINIIGAQSQNLLSSGFNPYVINGYNQVYFAPIDQPGVIAVTVVWGTFSAPVYQRQLVEWDQVYNENFAWSTTAEVGKMDFENIATHELGHVTGLADLYTSACSAQTMYGYASYGETNKRTLESGDIKGISRLY